jgi:hypothetical protein
LLSSTRYSAFLYPSRHPRRCSGTSKISTSICASISSFSLF